MCHSDDRKQGSAGRGIRLPCFCEQKILRKHPATVIIILKNL